MPKLTIFYTVHNNGDGSASVRFHDSAVAAQMATEVEENRDEAFCETNPGKRTLEFDDSGVLLNPSSTFAELAAEFNEVTGKDAPQNPVAAQKPRPKGKKPRP